MAAECSNCEELVSFRCGVTFLGLVFQCVCGCVFVIMCVSAEKGGKLGFGVGQGVLRQGYGVPVILMDV